ncbi:hypothetical protein BDP27DRAFT_1321479 [Rhodocollybia butyracea]|uniref:Uncharacterized protein n=1 Tax=Rhodocollybia butyracea TaxID=206335 RepID=A0A9P5PZ19_9AGAR|nr:hypothetical protein BDP27DRAFT_1321479 [Rhodocollybia butyracea]
MSSHRNRPAPIGSSSTTTPIRDNSDTNLLAAPPSFKRTIDLPSDPDDFQVSSTYAEDFNLDDEDVEMQHYLEQVYMSVGQQPLAENRPPMDVEGSNISEGLGLIQITPNVKHKLKNRDGDRSKQRRQDYSPGGNARAFSTYPQVAQREFVEGRSGSVRSDIDASDLGLKGFDELEALDIALVAPDEQQWGYGSEEPTYQHRGNRKGKGKTQDGW